MTRRSTLAVAAAVGLLVLLSSPHRPLVVWNSTASAPIGLYRVLAATRLRPGDLVLAFPPLGAARLAAERGYLPLGTPLVKHIAALGGDSICANGLRVSVNGTDVVTRLAADGEGRALPAWHGCQLLDAQQVFLLNRTVSHSFDGRYFGPIPRSNVVGRLRPLWLP